MSNIMLFDLNVSLQQVYLNSIIISSVRSFAGVIIAPLANTFSTAEDSHGQEGKDCE
jgi:hypothetical protein